MQRRLPGSSGFEISTIGLGTWAIGGHMWGRQDDALSVGAIHAAIDHGIKLCVGVLLQTPGLTGVIAGARNARQGGVIAGLGVGVTSEQAAAVWKIAETLAKDLEGL